MANERVAVVGAGGISDAWFKILPKEQLDIVAVVDLDLEKANLAVAKHGLNASAWNDLRKAMRKTKPDLVIDLTVPEAHCKVTCTALRAGCNVLGEKPMASTLPQARRMCRSAAAMGKTYAVSQSRRYNSFHEQIRRAISAGAIGPITTVNCDFYIPAHFTGFRLEMPSPLILDMAIHQFDLARFFTGLDATSVYAIEFNPQGSWYRGDAAATCVYQMTGGVVFTFRGSWCAEGCATSWHGNWRFVGEKGTILYENDKPPRGETIAKSEGFMYPTIPLEMETLPQIYESFHGSLHEMVTHMRGGPKPSTHCDDNIKSLAMVFAAIDSSRRHRPVPVRT